MHDALSGRAEPRPYTAAMADSPVPTVHAEPYRVRFDECGADGTLRTSTYLRYMQDVASAHSSMAGYTREWYREHGIFWVVRYLDLHVLGASGTGASVVVSTEVTGFRRIWARRRSEFHDPHGVLLAEADVDWVVTTEQGRPTRVPAEIVSRFPALLTKYTPGRLELPDPPESAFEVTRRAEPHELDPMAHVNNAAYIDQFEAALDGAGEGAMRTAFPRRYRIEYLAPAGPGVSLRWHVWPAGRAWAGRLRGDSGGELLRMVATTG